MTNHYAASSATSNQSINYTEQHNGEMSHSRSASALYTQQQQDYAGANYGRSESTSALPKQQPRGVVPPAGGEHVRREKDYNKHWLIQVRFKLVINKQSCKNFTMMQLR